MALDNTPPQIFVSTRPASLVVFDGEPVLAPVPGTTLSFAVNTNWDVFADSAAEDGGTCSTTACWLAAPEPTGPWMPAAKLPPSFAALPDDANFAAVKKQIPGRTVAAKDAPTIFVSTVPAAIIVTTGRRRYVSRSRARRCSTSPTPTPRCSATPPADACYFLVSGRWFSAPAFDGPWTFATAEPAARLRAHSRQRAARIRAGVGARHARRRRRR